MKNISNAKLSKLFPETFHTRSGRANGVGDAWGIGDEWVCDCVDCSRFRRQIWERLESSLIIETN